MIRTYKYRLSPTKKQRFVLDGLFFQMQTVYNDALNQRRHEWRQSRRSITYYDQWARMRDERPPARRNGPVERHIDSADVAPQWIRRTEPSTKGSAVLALQGAQPLQERRIPLRRRLQTDRQQALHPTRWRCARKLHRPIPDDAVIKQVIVKRSTGRWYVCFQLELPDPELTVHTGPAVGIDVGLHSLFGAVRRAFGG